MTAGWALSESARLRYGMGALLYFAQGIPQGLLAITIPAWLASNGVPATEIASYLAVISLPWAFKLLAGPLMDRFEFLPMGQRRPWVLGAQLGLSLALLALALIHAPGEHVGQLMLVGVLVNIFAATQDVAVDGMAIDLTPVREQGRLNGFMAFGKTVGWGVSSALSGVLLVQFGLAFTAICLAVASSLIWCLALAVLERPGERRLPWSAGEAGSKKKPDASFLGVFKGLKSALWTKVGVVVLCIMFFDGLVHGYGHALMPIAAVQLFGFSTPEWSALVASMGLVGAGLSLMMGPVIDRIGSKTTLIMTALLVVGHALLLGYTQQLWNDSTYVRVMLSIWVLLGPLVMVSVIALAMSVCESSVSATQFAVFMSAANLGSATGSKLYGVLSVGTQTGEAIILLGLIALLPIGVILFHKHDRATDAGHGRATHRPSVGAHAGAVFWSGAIRCPKCRADMEQVDLDGLTIDRCTACKGLWFDVGELDQLKSTPRVNELDTGSARSGRRNNHIDDYPCPRCGDEMMSVEDPSQTHIWFESCRGCRGSYFDAGEVKDLMAHTWIDHIRDWMASPRKQPSSGG